MKVKRIIEPALSDQVRMVAEKLEVDCTGASLSEQERALEVTGDETVYLLSVLAGREIKRSYLSQLTRDDKEHPRRLMPSRAVGHAYLYTVGSLLRVKFNRPKQASKEAQ